MPLSSGFNFVRRFASQGSFKSLLATANFILKFCGILKFVKNREFHFFKFEFSIYDGDDDDDDNDAYTNNEICHVADPK